MGKGFLQVAEYDKSGYCGFQVTSFKLQVGAKPEDNWRGKEQGGRELLSDRSDRSDTVDSQLRLKSSGK